jgi:transposase
VAGKVKISPTSVRCKRLLEQFHFYKTIPVTPISDDARGVRVAFTRARIAYPLHLDPATVFTDESMVGQDMNRGGIWRRRGELLPENTYEREQHPISVMVWGAIGPGFRSKLVRCPPTVDGYTYIEMIAKSGVLRDLNAHFGRGRYLWQQDNAPAHKPYLGELRKFVHVLPWPPHSPDLSPIEHMWALVKRLLRGKQFDNEDELFDAMSAAWDSIPMDWINKLCRSFPARCTVCIELDGHNLNGHGGRVMQVREALEAEAATPRTESSGH